MNDKLEIRAYRKSDFNSVDNLWQKVFPDEPAWNETTQIVNTKMQIQADLFFVATINDKLVGTVIAGFDGVRGWVHKLAVDTEIQGNGIAKQLMQAAEKGLAKLGCSKLNLQVRASNSAVIKFYENAGYTVEDRISMGKHLN